MRTRPASGGFTLLEVLVVVMIIGVLAGIAVLAIGLRPQGDRLELEARRLAALLELGAEEAQLRGIELGFARTQDGYQFLATVPDAGVWQVYEDSGPFRPRRFQVPLEAVLRVEQRLVPPPDPQAEPEPEVLLLSSGEITPFELALRDPSGGEAWLIRGGPLDTIRLAAIRHE